MRISDWSSDVCSSDLDVTIETCIDTGDPFLCSLIHRDTRGSLWIGNTGFVEATNQNIGSLSTTGIDFNVSYGTELGSMGSLSASIVGTWLNELIKIGRAHV